MSTERDELANVIGAVTDNWDEPLDEVHDIPGIANAVLAWIEEHYVPKPRTITTVEELDALKLESVVKSAEGNVWEFLVGGWFETASRACHVASDIALPATVLYAPEPTP